MRPADLLATGISPDPDPARDWVRAELAKREYQPSPLERVVGWFMDFLNKILDAANGIGRLHPAVAAVLLIVLVAGLAFVLARLRRDPSARGRLREEALLPDVRITASEHRTRAERARDAGRYDEAVVEALRAIAVGLVERAVIDDVPGATAREVTDQAAAAFADLAPRLRVAADRFDGVRYGDRHAERDTADELLGLEKAVRHARPAEGAVTTTVLAVPR